MCCLYAPHIIILCCSSIIWRDAMKKACSCFLKSKRSITLYLWQCLAYGWIYRFLRWRKFSSASKALAKWETSLEMRHAFIGPQVPQKLYFKSTKPIQSWNFSNSESFDRKKLVRMFHLGKMLVICLKRCTNPYTFLFCNIIL